MQKSERCMTQPAASPRTSEVGTISQYGWSIVL
jgi:hypothetical protein